MWRCQLCQRDFNDAEVKHEIPTVELRRAFMGVAEFRTDNVISYLYEDCFNEYKNVLNNSEEV